MPSAAGPCTAISAVATDSSVTVAAASHRACSSASTTSALAALATTRNSWSPTRYTMICAQDGGVIDDLVVYRARPTASADSQPTSAASNAAAAPGPVIRISPMFDLSHSCLL